MLRTRSSTYEVRSYLRERDIGYEFTSSSLAKAIGGDVNTTSAALFWLREGGYIDYTGRKEPGKRTFIYRTTAQTKKIPVLDRAKPEHHTKGRKNGGVIVRTVAPPAAPTQQGKLSERLLSLAEEIEGLQAKISAPIDLSQVDEIALWREISRRRKAEGKEVKIPKILRRENGK